MIELSNTNLLRSRLFFGFGQFALNRFDFLYNLVLALIDEKCQRCRLSRNAIEPQLMIALTHCASSDGMAACLVQPVALKCELVL